MASGVAVSEEVINNFNSIRVRRQDDKERERFKLMVMCLSDDKKSIIVDETNCLKNKDVENESDILRKVLSMFPPKECRYAVYDCTYENKESLKEDLVFIMWAPETAPMKDKMIYASSKTDLKKKLTGLKFEWQMNDPSDGDASCLVEKLGGKLKSLEGKKLT